MKKGLKINTEQDEDVEEFVRLTTSGTFAVGDFFKINQHGYEFSDSPLEGSNQAGLVQRSPRGHPEEVTALSELQIIRGVGQGSSGVVQKVLHTPTNRVLALKVVPLDLTEKKSKQVITELRTLHSSNSPQIVSFHGAFYRENAISLVLEYMDGGSLADALKTVKSIDERNLAKIAVQVLRGLSYLHTERHIIHRDIKPSNILLNQQGQVKIADFGVSGEVTAHDEKTSSKISFVGTVTYMSPERIQGKSHSYDSDIWSLGLALAECALGYFPYSQPQPPPAELDMELYSQSPTNASLQAQQQQQLSNSNSNSSKAPVPVFFPAFPLSNLPVAAVLSPNEARTMSPTSAVSPLAAIVAPALSMPLSPSHSSALQPLSLEAHIPLLPSPSNSNSNSGATTPRRSASSQGGSGQRKNSKMGFWDVMERIVATPPPALPADRFSPEMCQFISACLQKEPSMRPSAKDLLSHPFIKKHEQDSSSLASWVRKVRNVSDQHYIEAQSKASGVSGGSIDTQILSVFTPPKLVSAASSLHTDESPSSSASASSHSSVSHSSLHFPGLASPRASASHSPLASPRLSLNSSRAIPSLHANALDIEYELPVPASGLSNHTSDSSLSNSSASNAANAAANSVFSASGRGFSFGFSSPEGKQRKSRRRSSSSSTDATELLLNSPPSATNSGSLLNADDVAMQLATPEMNGLHHANHHSAHAHSVSDSKAVSMTVDEGSADVHQPSVLGKRTNSDRERDSSLSHSSNNSSAMDAVSPRKRSKH